MKYSNYIKNRLKQYDIVFLLRILLLFSCGISFLYGRQSESVAPSISDKEALQSIKSLDVAQGLKKIVEFVSQLPFEQQLRILKTIIADQQSALTIENKMALGLGLANARAIPQERSSFIKILLESPQVDKTPLLYIAVLNKYDAVVPSIIENITKSEREAAIYKSLLHAIDNNQLNPFARLIDAAKGIKETLATKLLWDVLEKNKDEQFIPILVQQKAHINEPRNGKTPLVAAVDLQNIEMIQKLLEAGAEVNKFDDPAIGTPLQRVQSNSKKIEKQKDQKYKNSATTIELLLRQHGAKE